MCNVEAGIAYLVIADVGRGRGLGLLVQECECECCMSPSMFVVWVRVCEWVTVRLQRRECCWPASRPKAVGATLGVGKGAPWTRRGLKSDAG